MESNIINRLRKFDAYPKTLEDFRIKTFGGAAVTAVSGILMLVLFVSELNYYLTTEIHPELFVDTSKGQKLKINIDITFPNLGCSFISLDAMDVSGEQQINVDHNVYKERLNPDGKPVSELLEKEDVGSSKNNTAEPKEKAALDPNRCESCYGAENLVQKCCNTCEDVREAYRKKGWAFTNPEIIAQCSREGWTAKVEEQTKEGCRVFGYLEVNKVAGNFHLAPGKSFSQHHIHVHDLHSYNGMKFNLSHSIKHLSFGTDYPGIVNPLDNTQQHINEKTHIMYQYYVKVVPTTYVKLVGETLYTNQYSVTTHSKLVSQGFGQQGLPGVFFMYELSPMMVKYTEKQRSFMHFLTGVCAIIGGIFTVAGLIDSMIYHSANAIKKKIELGKTS